MALPKLTPIKKLATYKSTKANPKPVVQVKRIEKMKTHKYKLWLSDGSDCHDAYVDCALKKSKQLEEGSIVRLVKYLPSRSVGNTTVIRILDLDVIPDMMALDITLGTIRELKTMTNPNPVVQVIDIEKMETHKYKLLLSDGLYFHEACVDCWTLKKLTQLEEGSIVRLAEYLRTSVDNVTTVIKVLDLDVIHTECDIIGHPKPFPYSATPSVEVNYHDSLPPEEHPLLKWLYNSCYPEKLDYSATPSVEVNYHDSLPPEEHPLLKWLYNSSYPEKLEWETESEDGFIIV